MLLKSCFVIIIINLLIIIQLEQTSGQRRTPQRNRNNKDRNRTRVKPKFTIKKKQTTEDDKKQIQCLVCNGEFLLNDYGSDHLCYNPGINASATRQSLLSSCPLTSKYCITEVTRIHGVFSSISRRCGGAFCVEACFHKSFGIERESCTFCCEPVKEHNFATVSEMMESVMSGKSIESNTIDSSANNATRTKLETLAINLGNMTFDDQNNSTNLTYKQQKELLHRQQAIQMLSAYNCPATYRNEF